MSKSRIYTATAVVMLTAFLAILFVHPDFYPALHTFGWSVGTSTHYCSLDVVNYIPHFSCQAGQ